MTQSIKSSKSEASRAMPFQNTRPCLQFLNTQRYQRLAAAGAGQLSKTPVNLVHVTVPSFVGPDGKRGALSGPPAKPSVKLGLGVEEKQAVLLQIKLAATWEQVATVVASRGVGKLQHADVAYALYRLGCLNAFLSHEQQAELRAAGLLDRLLVVAQHRLPDYTAQDVTLTLDCLARTGHTAEAALMAGLINLAELKVEELTATQVPLVLWAFARTGTQPGEKLLAALAAQAEVHSTILTTQGVLLVVWAYQTLAQNPGQGLLGALCASMVRRLHAFKPRELAQILEAFSALGFEPSAALVAGIKRRLGMAVGAMPLPLPSDAVIVPEVQKPLSHRLSLLASTASTPGGSERAVLSPMSSTLERQPSKGKSIFSSNVVSFPRPASAHNLGALLEPASRTASNENLAHFDVQALSPSPSPKGFSKLSSPGQDGEGLDRSPSINTGNGSPSQKRNSNRRAKVAFMGVPGQEREAGSGLRRSHSARDLHAL